MITPCCCSRSQDFPGQKLYDVTNPLFWSPRGVYVLVWRMPHEGKGTDAEKNALLGVSHWLRKLNSDLQRPRVFLVGTHAELLQKKDRTRLLKCAHALATLVELSHEVVMSREQLCEQQARAGE